MSSKPVTAVSAWSDQYLLILSPPCQPRLLARIDHLTAALKAKKEQVAQLKADNYAKDQTIKQMRLRVANMETQSYLGIRRQRMSREENRRLEARIDAAEAARKTMQGDIETFAKVKRLLASQTEKK